MSTEHKTTVLRTNDVEDTVTIRVSRELAQQLKYGDPVTLVIAEGTA